MCIIRGYNFSRHTVVTEESVEVNDTESPQKRLVYHHKIESGITNIEHYGLSLAEKTNLPENTIKLAKELAEFIVKNKTVTSEFICVLNVTIV